LEVTSGRCGCAAAGAGKTAADDVPAYNAQLTVDDNAKVTNFI